MSFAFKTLSEQRLEWLESLRRPLTNQESDELRRALHAVYCRNRKHRILAQHENEERALLAKVEAESRQPDPGRFER
jgi:hypothetical protein